MEILQTPSEYANNLIERGFTVGEFVKQARTHQHMPSIWIDKVISLMVDDAQMTERKLTWFFSQCNVSCDGARAYISHPQNKRDIDREKSESALRDYLTRAKE